MLSFQLRQVICNTIKCILLIFIKKIFPTNLSKSYQYSSLSTEMVDYKEIQMEAMKYLSKGPYRDDISAVVNDVNSLQKKVDSIHGIMDIDTGLLPDSKWNLTTDEAYFQTTSEPFNVATVEKKIADAECVRYIISISHVARFVVGLAKNVAIEDIEEGIRVGVDRRRYYIQRALPTRIDPIVTTMQVEEKPDVTYDNIGGSKEQIDMIREVVETPLLHPEYFEELGIDPPKGVLLYGPPGTGKTLLARAVANRTQSVFIRVIGSELVQKYIGEGARMVREIFQMARAEKSCIVFFDEVDAFATSRVDAESAENEVQRTMLELITQLDGFDSRGNIKVLMATNRPDTLDPALLRPGRLDRKIEFGVPDLKGRETIFRIHTKEMKVEKNIRYELLARQCPNATGADICSVCTEAAIICIRSRRNIITEKDFLQSINKVIKGYAKFSATPSYMQYN